MHEKRILKAVTLVCVSLAFAGLTLTACKNSQVISKYVRYDLVADTAGSAARGSMRACSTPGHRH